MMPNDVDLYRRIDEVVHYVWDPIGVSDIPEARDEYQSYLPTMFGRVKEGDLDNIVSYMDWIVTERMGMAFDRDRAVKAAQLMLKWKAIV